MKVTIYTTNCPKCNILKKKLEQKSISFKEVDGQQAIDFALRMGFQSAPVLTVDNETMNYDKAVEWVNSYTVNRNGED